FFTAPPSTVISPLSLHDALPISAPTGSASLPVAASASSASKRCPTPRPASTARLVPSDAASTSDPAALPTGRTGRPLLAAAIVLDRKSTRLNSSHLVISYAVFCL